MIIIDLSTKIDVHYNRSWINREKKSVSIYFVNPLKREIKESSGKNDSRTGLNFTACYYCNAEIVSTASRLNSGLRRARIIWAVYRGRGYNRVVIILFCFFSATIPLSSRVCRKTCTHADADNVRDGLFSRRTRIARETDETATVSIRLNNVSPCQLRYASIGFE